MPMRCKCKERVSGCFYRGSRDRGFSADSRVGLRFRERNFVKSSILREGSYSV